MGNRNPSLPLRDKMSVSKPDLAKLKALVGNRVIAYHQPLARLCDGDALVALFLSQCLYWTERTTDPHGWFYKSRAEWQSETALTRAQQDRVRKELKAKGYLYERRQGRKNGTVHFKVDVVSLCTALSRLVGNQQTSGLGCRISAIHSAENRPSTASKSGQPYKEAENTKESTTERPALFLDHELISVFGIPSKSEFVFVNSYSPEEAFRLAKGELEKVINRHSFDTWLRPTRVIGAEGTRLILGVPTPDFFSIREKYGPQLLLAIEKFGYTEVEVRVRAA